jgi:hypothetical protein
MVGITGSPAAARPLGPDDTPSARSSGAAADGAHCPLRRVEHQLVRCDNLTGAGVAAPVWIEES